MKILFAASCPSDPNLGVPGVMHSLGAIHREAGHEVRFLFRDKQGRFAEAKFGLDLLRGGDARWADVVDVHAVDAWPLCTFRGRRPVVVARSHGLERVVHRRLMEAVRRGEERVGPIYRLYRGSIRLWLERAAVRGADATLVLNASDRAECLRDLGGSPERVLQVVNGYPPAFLESPIAPSRNGVAFVGSWLRRKGNDLAISALTELRRRNPSARIVLLGAGVPEGDVRSAFPEDVQGSLDIRPRFERGQLPELLRECGILLFPSRSEGYPLSLVEAMACGLAPVATAIPGVVDVVRDEVSGLLVPSEDVGALTDALVALVCDPERLDALRAGARDAVADTSWKAVAAQQEALYLRLLASRGTAS